MQLPLISIIIPVYMVESYIEQCIQSVQKQTYKRLEVLIVDDGSPDKSIEKAKAITQGNDRFIYLQKKNSGLADARNMGLDHATGEYITFLDSDDFLFEDAIETLFHGIRLGKHSLAIATFCRFSNQRFQFLSFGEYQIKFSKGEELLEQMNTSRIQFMNLTAAWGKLYKRSLFQNIRFPSGKKNEDSFITWKLFLEAQDITLLPHPIYVYRDNPNGIMNNYSLGHLDSIEALELKIKEMKRLGLNLDSTITFYRDHLIWHSEMLEKHGFLQEKLNIQIKLQQLSQNKLDFM
ncbi:glycosyltransferase family 2 protein [Streptococcus suis]|uniref:glycosyltransferase family 2 protein n=1 Tax=Streptococcus suis TaxID=1307 RepID=UPI00195F3563|nr:glycosyltransferase family A protein [Streptococcus suis]MBM7192242.1 glycosyltransferase family 2 protein [Streptococcus suis]MCO8224616.1 glycosyltransferase family 2 protein [Streptococcus suis]HEM3485688.1 glycosyltransferase family 2 protein [Streptococcus suis]